MGLDEIIRNAIDEVLMLEYHHAMDDGLEDDARNICKIVMEMYKLDLVDPYRPMPTNIDYCKTYESKGLGVRVMIWLSDQLTATVYQAPNTIYVPTVKVEEALKSNNSSILTQLIYHELGHMVNFTKAKNFNQTSLDFNPPMFLGANDEEYNRLHKVLYRFQTREMKARCFETRMFLRNSQGNLPSLEEVYSNRCSDISMMRDFLDELNTIANEGEDSPKAFIIKSLSRDTWMKNRLGRKSDKWEIMCKNTIRYFAYRYQWLKKRIDKIYSDFKLGYQEDEKIKG